MINRDILVMDQNLESLIETPEKQHQLCFPLTVREKLKNKLLYNEIRSEIRYKVRNCLDISIIYKTV